MKMSSEESMILEIYQKEIGKFPLLTPEEEKELFQKMAEGDEKAKEKIIKSNLRLVIWVVNKFFSYTDMSKLDIVQAGNIGLIKAVEKYNYKKGYKFATYAVWWIINYIHREVKSNERTIRIPINTLDNLVKIKRILENTNGSKEEAYKEIEKLLKIDRKEAENIIILEKEIIPLDQIKRGQDGEFLDSEKVLSSNEPSISDIVSKILLRKDLEKFLKELPRREEIAVKAYFGFYGQEITLTEIGQLFGVSRERARQIVNNAIEKLRKKAKGKELEEYIYE